MTLPLSVEVFDTLHELMRMFRTRLRKSMEAVHPELTFNEVRILMRTGLQPGITQKELVEHSQIDKAQLARTLGHMQDQGWLERRVSDSDKRVRCLQLSPQGRRLVGRLREVQEQVAHELLQGCTPALQTQLLTLLQQAQSSASAHLKLGTELGPISSAGSS